MDIKNINLCRNLITDYKNISYLIECIKEEIHPNCFDFNGCTLNDTNGELGKTIVKNVNEAVLKALEEGKLEIEKALQYC